MMKNNCLGLTDERFSQMMRSYQDDLEAVKNVVDDWGVDVCNRGYEIFDFDGTGMLEIEAIYEVGAFDDQEAAEKAAADGIKIIPEDELPEGFDRKYFGWIDTPENRRRIEEYTKNLNSEEE